MAFQGGNLKIGGNGLRVSDVSRLMQSELKDPNSNLSRAFEELGLNKKASTPQFPIGAIYKATKKLKEYGFLKTCPGFPRDRYALTIPGNEFARTINESFKKTSPSIYETICNNYYCNIKFGPLKFNPKLHMEMRDVSLLTRYELHDLNFRPLVFACVNNKGVFNKQLGQVTYVWLVPVSKLYWGILDVWFANVKRLGGVVLGLEKTHEGFDNGAFIIKYDHHKLAEMVEYPVEIEHGINTVIKKRTTEIFFKMPFITYGFVIILDYTETEFDWVNVEHSFDEEPTIKHDQDKKIIKVYMGPNVRIYPRQGISFSFGKD